MINYDLAIELGTQNTTIYKRGSGIVLKEPSLVAIEMVGRKKNFHSVGDAAKKVVGDENSNLTVFEPIVEGVIINKQLAIIMLKELLKKVDADKLSKYKVMFVVPVGLTDKEKNKILSIGYALNFNTVTLIPSSVASLVGMDADLTEPGSHIIVSLGAGVSDISIITKGVIVRGATITVAGKPLSGAIAKYLRDRYSLVVGEEISHQINKEIVSLFENDKNALKVVGVDADTKQYKEALVTSKEIFPIVTEFFEKITECINAIIEASSSQVVADIARLGIYICGGLSQISGLETYLRKQLNFPVYIDADPSLTTIYGAGKLLDNSDLLQTILENIK